MDRIPLKCEVCGATLEVPAGVHAVHCQHCRATFKVRHHEGTIHLELITENAEGTSRLNRSTQIMHLQSRLAQLDHEWAQYMSGLRAHRNEDSRQYEPSKAFFVILSLSFFTVGSMLIYWGVRVPNAQPVAIVGGLIFGGSILFGYWKIRTVNRYRLARSKYHELRTSVEEELRQLEY